MTFAIPRRHLPRRHVLVGAGALGLLAACGKKELGPATVALTVTAAAGMSPVGNEDRPVTLRLFRLRDAGAFSSSTYIALQDPAAALGASLLGSEDLIVGPGATVPKSVAMEPEATALGIMAMLSKPSGKEWRAALATPPGARITATATLGPAGLAVTTG